MNYRPTKNLHQILNNHAERVDFEAAAAEQAQESFEDNLVAHGFFSAEHLKEVLRRDRKSVV